MAFVDEIKLHLKAGDGGDGVVRFLHLKGKEYAGPSGGNGGNGGDVYALAIRDSAALARYRHQKSYKAENGVEGGNNSLFGRNGEDFVLELPVGSIITNKNTKDSYELTESGQKILLLKGGRGGLGNEHFKSSRNVKPEESTNGKKGEDADFFIELRLVADVGFVGFPNAGKSSLLNELTNAQAKVGGYEFTTLDPNLGSLYGYILADIPGIIEGASEGKGLGHKFLRHISRTGILLHMVSLEQEDVLGAYNTIRSELAKYSDSLVEKREILVLSKTDLADEQTIKDTIKKLENSKDTVYEKILTVSVYDDKSIKNISDELVKILRQ